MNSADDWISLLGGNVNTFALKGNIVRRKLTDSSPPVHRNSPRSNQKYS